MNNHTTTPWSNRDEMLSLSNIRKIDPKCDGLLSYVQSPKSNTPLLPWINANREYMSELLSRNRPILLRGFYMADDQSLYQVIHFLLGELENEYGDLPLLADLQSYVFQSTPYPADHAILFHNEASHWPAWPRFLAFYCQEPAYEGGQTPLCSSEELWNYLPQNISSPLKDHGLIYRRVFIPGIDVPWQKFFRTSDPRTVEELCEKYEILTKWINGRQLQIETKVPAVYIDENNKENVFQQILLYHSECLGENVAQSSKFLYAPGEEPRSVRFGNQDPINNIIVDTLLDAMIHNSFCFDWQKSDLLIVDNLKYSHARRSFRGNRSIKVLLSKFRQPK